MRFRRLLLETDKSSRLVILWRDAKVCAGVPRHCTVIDFSLLIMIVIHLSSLLLSYYVFVKGATASEPSAEMDGTNNTARMGDAYCNECFSRMSVQRDGRKVKVKEKKARQRECPPLSSACSLAVIQSPLFRLCPLAPMIRCGSSRPGAADLPPMQLRNLSEAPISVTGPLF